jgi:hypothetical protein
MTSRTRLVRFRFVLTVGSQAEIFTSPLVREIKDQIHGCRLEALHQGVL